MKPEEMPIGVECAWIPREPAPRAGRPWIGATAALVAAAVSLLAYDAWSYVAFAFFS